MATGWMFPIPARNVTPRNRSSTSVATRPLRQLPPSRPAAQLFKPVEQITYRGWITVKIDLHAVRFVATVCVRRVRMANSATCLVTLRSGPLPTSACQNPGLVKSVSRCEIGGGSHTGSGTGLAVASILRKTWANLAFGASIYAFWKHKKSRFETAAITVLACYFSLSDPCPVMYLGDSEQSRFPKAIAAAAAKSWRG